MKCIYIYILEVSIIGGITPYHIDLSALANLLTVVKLISLKDNRI